MVTLISWTAWVSVIDRASARGAAANTSSEISWVVSATVLPERSHSTSERTPAWATSVTQERWSAGRARNHGRVSSTRVTAEVASDPAVRSMRRRVAASGGLVVPAGRTLSATHHSVPRPDADARPGTVPSANGGFRPARPKTAGHEAYARYGWGLCTN